MYFKFGKFLARNLPNLCILNLVRFLQEHEQIYVFY